MSDSQVDVPVPKTSGSNSCFGCGPSNPIGLHLQFTLEELLPQEPTAKASVHLPRFYEGGVGNLHGGIIATLLDEAMSKLNKPLGVYAMTRQMDVEYLRPSPVEQTLTLIGRHIRREGSKLFHQAELLNEDGRLLARGKALFIVVERPSRENGAR